MRQKLFSAIFLFAWGTLFLVSGIMGLDFWGSISICFVFAILGFSLGIRDLRAYLRSRQNRP
jgi:hypothetical protein